MTWSGALSVDGRMISRDEVMQDTLLELGGSSSGYRLDQHYTTEFVPVKI